MVGEHSVDHQNKGKTACYKNFPDFCKRVQELKSMREWSVEVEEDRVVFKKTEASLCLPELDLMTYVAKIYQIGLYILCNLDMILQLKYMPIVMNPARIASSDWKS